MAARPPFIPQQPSGRVTLAQLQADYQELENAANAENAALRDLSNAWKVEGQAQANYDAAITELNNVQLPETKTAMDELTKQLTTPGSSAQILQAWRDMATQMGYLTAQLAGAANAKDQLNDAKENSLLADQTEISTMSYYNEQTKLVNADLRALSLIPPGP
jgi:hypothetical protein